ncbi:hypothetical protein [Sphingomonas psychrotolerans]|uniref:Uncharacterized protein n=1 Tax=Sphingomonas psychrotolerans TaxID=1327635 RepID=A0A2K8MP56_9SPHN|nr:hypothetical protein [Sphingomonas psychrotolerans]ATY33759.1 hypothetical protein CVN68_18830 [Sphingomonas psychrotolerans]
MSGADHPFVPEWKGERSWSAPGELPSTFVVFEAGDLGAPFRIEHGRDMMFNDGELEQDYNFIDYFFGDPDAPIRARHYLHDEHVSVVLPSLPSNVTLAQVGAFFPSDTLQYLQRRFASVQVLTAEGYSELWAPR